MSTNRVLLASMVSVNGPLGNLMITGTRRLWLNLQLMVVPSLWDCMCLVRLPNSIPPDWATAIGRIMRLLSRLI